MFTVYLGPKKVVVLAGFKTVKEALVNYADEFGDRDPILCFHEVNGGNGKEIQLLSNLSPAVLVLSKYMAFIHVFEIY